MKIIIDAMGGDNAPLEIVKGALSARARFGCDIVLTGDEAAIRDAAARPTRRMSTPCFLWASRAP